VQQRPLSRADRLPDERGDEPLAREPPQADRVVLARHRPRPPAARGGRRIPRRIPPLPQRYHRVGHRRGADES